MLALPAALLLAVCSTGETVLIDFSAEWCGPCRQMEPTVARLAAAGYPVRKVDIDHDQALAAQFHVQSIPCFVLVVDGREAERSVGATSYEQLAAMFSKHGVDPGATVKRTRGQSPDALSQTFAVAEPRRELPQSQPLSPAKPKTPPSAGSAPDVAPQLLAASVRLKISDPKGHSYGSGTIIDLRGGEALIITCGHVFRDSQGQGKVVVDMFGAGAPRGLPGRIIGYDLKSDVGLVSFQPGCPVRTAKLAAPSYPVQRGEPVINIGCNNGAEPTVRTSHVASLDKFLGPPNIQVAGQPVQGRSGGGLFTADGRVIGVCNAADPADDEGLYAALPSIWALLGQHGLSPEIANDPPANVGDGGWNAGAVLAKSAAPAMPQRMPATATTSTAATPASFDSSQQAALAALAAATPGAEVICIVRSLNDPHAKSEVVVLDKVSPQFLQRLTAERFAQQQRVVPAVAQRQETPGATLAPRGTVVRDAPIINVRGGTSSAANDWRPKWMHPK